MQNLTRVLSLTAALVLAALTIPASAQTTGSCSVRCQGSGIPPVTYTVSATKADCCSGNVPNNCPAGSTPVVVSWNSTRCAV